jgi:tetratricopeptide (TPR) repeat protein
MNDTSVSASALVPGTNAGDTASVREAVAAAWEALSRGSWNEALALVGGDDGDPQALEAAGVAYWWLDDADATLAARERAYRLYRAQMDPVGAARVAGALAWDALLFDGRTAVARGWLERASRLLAEENVSHEHAWLAIREAEVALATGSASDARAAAERAVWIATELRQEELEVIGRSLEGLALVHEGAVDEGMRRLDESAVAATAGDVTDLMWIGKVCCNLIAACERVGDLERAAQWSAEVKEFAARWELRALFNTCRTQYAGVLLQTGEWKEAEAELQAALAAFAGGRRAALAEGTAKLGELRRRQGRLDEARELFAQAERSWAARVGTIELALDEEDPRRALALAERLKRATEEDRHLDRASVLALFVRAAVAADRLDAAAETSIELERLAAKLDTPGALAARDAGSKMQSIYSRRRTSGPARNSPSPACSSSSGSGPLHGRRPKMPARRSAVSRRAAP